jgi:hypothetical protein
LTEHVFIDTVHAYYFNQDPTGGTTMHASIPQHQTPQDYVLAKINRIYGRNRKLHLAKRHQVILRHRKRLVRARAQFKQALGKALSPRTQEGLGIVVRLDEQHLATPGFIAYFEFEGQRWILAHQRQSWHSEWFFKREDHAAITRCSPQTLEAALCYSLGRFHHESRSAHYSVA